MLHESLKSTSFFVSEVLQKIDRKKTSLTIGVPKENQNKEKRLALTPEAVMLLVDAGHRVIVEKEAGIGINYADRYYAESGAEITDTREDVFQADVIVKIAPPTFNEVQITKSKSTIFSFLQLHIFTADTLRLMAEKRINALAYELLHDHSGTSPFVTAISEIEGATAIMLAAEMLSNIHGGKGILMGGVPGVSPTKVVIIGAGTAGTIAARAAFALGAMVKVFDNDIEKLRKIQRILGHTFFTSTLQPNVLRNSFRSADVVIGAMHYINQTHRYLISSDLVRELKKGALIIDLRMAQGGCFETSAEACFPNSPTTFERFGVMHVCEMSISSRVARTASIALSNIFSSLLTDLVTHGGINGFAQSDRGFSAGFYMFSGKIVNAYLGNYFNLPVSDIGLFLAGY